MTTPTREELIIMYFFKGYHYKLIVDFLVSILGIVLSKRQLKRILESMGLRRKEPQTPLFNQVLRSLVQVSCKVLPLNMKFAIYKDLFNPFNSKFNFTPCRLHPTSNGNSISESHPEYEGHAHHYVIT